MQHEEFAVSGDKPHLSPNTQQDPCGISAVCGDKCHLSPQNCPGSNENSGIRGDNSRLSPLKSEIREQFAEQWAVIVVIVGGDACRLPRPQRGEGIAPYNPRRYKGVCCGSKKEPVLVALSCGTKAESARRPDVVFQGDRLPAAIVTGNIYVQPPRQRNVVLPAALPMVAHLHPMQGVASVNCRFLLSVILSLSKNLCLL